jgi:ribonuclease HI
MRSTPAIEELKRNVDCSAFGKPGRARIGGVLRDHKGVVLCLFSAFVGIKESNETELLAVLKALELAASRDELCGKRFMIESDSANVVNWMRDKSKRPWKFHDIFIRAARFMAVLKLVHYAPCSMALTNILIYLLSFFLRNELGDWWSWLLYCRRHHQRSWLLILRVLFCFGEVMMGCEEMELGDSEECLNFSLV